MTWGIDHLSHGSLFEDRKAAPDNMPLGGRAWRTASPRTLHIAVVRAKAKVHPRNEDDLANVSRGSNLPLRTPAPKASPQTQLHERINRYWSPLQPSPSQS